MSRATSTELPAPRMSRAGTAELMLIEKDLRQLSRAEQQHKASVTNLCKPGLQPTAAAGPDTYGFLRHRSPLGTQDSGVEGSSAYRSGQAERDRWQSKESNKSAEESSVPQQLVWLLPRCLAYL